MLFIVAGHSVIHGINEISLTVNGMLAIVLTQGSRIGVDIFILITGYFSVGKEVTVKKIKKLYIQIITYSLIITIVMCVLGETSVSSLIYALLPVVTSRYWFVTCYVMLILLSPALQIFIKYVDKSTYQKILIIFFVMWSVCPTLHIGQPGYSNFAWFVYVYLIAAYMRIWKPKIIYKLKVFHGVLFLALIELGAISTYTLGNNIAFFKENAIYLYSEMNTISGITCAVLLFCGFKNMKMKSNYTVNKIAGCMFGVYLFHDNPYIRYFLWIKVLKNAYWFDKKMFPFHMLISILAVFGMGIIIEYIRQKSVKRLFR